jgi:hypothetical protein
MILHSSSFVILSVHFIFIICLKHLFTNLCNILVIWLVEVPVCCDEIFTPACHSTVWEVYKRLSRLCYSYGRSSMLLNFRFIDVCTVMRRITTFRSTTDRIHDGGPTRL